MINTDSQLGKWDYSGLSEACYSDTKQESYKKAAEFLVDNVEDWGCGTAWSKRYFKHYKGVDGSTSNYIKKTVDLVDYTSQAENILIRQTLEYNPEWKQILENAKQSFSNKLCLIILTPFVKKTRIGRYHKVYKHGKVVSGQMVPEMYFHKQDILDMFPAPEYRVSEKTIKTQQEYGHDWILYVQKI